MRRRGNSERQFGEEEEAVPGKETSSMSKIPGEEMSLVWLEKKKKRVWLTCNEQARK